MFRTLGFGRRVLQVTSITTSFLLLPSSVQAWNLVPESSVTDGTNGTPLMLDGSKMAQLQANAAGLAPLATLAALKEEQLRQLESGNSNKEEAGQSLNDALQSSGKSILESDLLYRALEPSQDPFAHFEQSQPRYILPKVDVALLLDQARSEELNDVGRRTELASSRVVRGKVAPRRSTTIRRGKSPEANRTMVKSETIEPVPSHENVSDVAGLQEKAGPNFVERLNSLLQINVLEMTPEEELAEADRRMAEGRLAEAALLYFDIEDSAPGSEAARFATESIASLGRQVEAGGVSPDEFGTFLANLPTFEDCQTIHGKYWLALTYRVAGVAAQKLGADVKSAEYFTTSRSIASRLIQDHPEDPLQILIVRAYMAASRKLGDEILTASRAELKSLLAREGTYDLVRFAALSELGFDSFTYVHDTTESSFHYGNLVDEYTNGRFDQALEAQSPDPSVNAHVRFAYGYALYQLNQREEALNVFNNCIETYPNGGSGTDLCRYYRALTQRYMGDANPLAGVEAFEQALMEKPNSTVADTELFMLGGIYLDAANFESARETFQQLLAFAPEGRFAPLAQKALERVDREEALEATHQLEVEAQITEAGHGNKNLCGVYTVARLLKQQGVDVAWSDILATMPDTLGQKLSLQDLQQLSASFGVELEGVKLHSLEQSVLPFIAHLKNDHYVIIDELKEDRVTLREIGEPITYMARKSFEERFSGAALVTVADESFAKLLSADELVSIVGGSGGLGDGTDEFSGSGAAEAENTGLCPNGMPCWVCNACDCDAENKKHEADRAAMAAKGNSCNKGNSNVPPPGGQQDSTTNPTSTNPDPKIRIATGAAGTSGYLNPRQSSQTFAEVDFRAEVRGANDLQFTRQWSNPFGYLRGYAGDTARPYRNNIGMGWTHRYNIHLRISTEEGYVLFINRNGDHAQFKETSAGSHIYKRSAGMLAYWLEGATIEKNTSTGKWTYTDPTEATYTFSAMVDTGTGGDRYCRLEKIEDVSANALTLSYDDSVRAPYGILTKVSAPGSDTRHILFLWDSGTNLITKTRLMADSTTELKYIEYFQSGAGYLTKVRVQGNTGKEIKYDYAVASDITHDLHGTYISKVTDRKGVETNFDFQYDYSSSLTYFQPTKMRILYDNDLDVVVTKTGWPTNYTKAQVATYAGANYNSGTNSYSGNPMTIWEQEAEGATDGVGTKYFRYFPDPSNLASYKQWNYEYQADGQLTKIKTPAGDTWEQRSYTANGRLNQRHNFGTLTQDYNYATSTDFDADYVIGADGTKTYYYYDSQGRITREAHPSHSASDPPGSTDGRKYVYDSYGQLTQVTEPDGRVFTYQFNSKGFMTKLIMPDDSVSTPTHAIEYLYDDYGMMTQAKDPMGKFTYYTYADEGCGGCGGSVGRKLVEVEDDDGHTTTFAYDANGNQTKVTDALGRETTYHYDTMNRVTKVDDPAGRSSTVNYHLLGRITKQTAPTGEVTEYAYNAMGQLTATINKNVTPGSDITVAYTYDDLGNLTKVTDGNGNDTTYAYSTTNLLTKTTDEVGKNIYYFYDSYRRMTKTAAGTYGTVDPTTYTYNSTKGQLSTTTYVNGTITKAVNYYYDTYGRVTNLVDWLNPGVSTGHFFEFESSTGRMTRYRDFDDNPSGTRKKLDYLYDYAGRVTSMTDYDGNVTTYTYTDTGELSTLTAPGSKVWDFDYNALHQRTQVTYPNGMKALYSYDTANRMTKLEYNDGAGSPTVLDGWEYELADDGNILRMASLTSSQRWDYGYDGKNRLTSAIRANASGVPQSREEYSYDAGDNMLTKRAISYKEGIKDDFTDGDYTASPAWTVSAGTWAVDSTGKYLKNTGTTSDQLRIGNTEENVELWGRYRIDAASTSTDYIEFTMLYSFDHSPTDYMSVRVHPDKIQFRERFNSVWDTEDVTIASAEDQWYQIYIRLDGATAEVWRGKDGEGLALVGRITDVQTVNTSRLYINTAGNIQAHFDDLYYAYQRSGSDTFVDDFSDGTYSPEWTVSGSWGTAGNYLNSNSSASAYAAVRTVSAADNQLKVSVKKNMAGNSLRVYAREVDSTHKVYVEITDSAVNLKQQDGSTTTLDTASLTTTVNTWYDYHIICDGKRIEVWRGPQGGTTELILESSAVTILSTDSVVFATHNATASFDNIQFIASDPKSTTFAYNGANELTTMTEGSTTTTYTYDDWGRTVSKTDGTYSATYLWLFGDKLKQYATDFPGEGDVAFNYDGLGKRRNKLNHVNGVYSDADWTWYRWDAGWNMIGEYAAGTDAGTEWDAGALTRWYHGKAAHADGDPDSTAYNYYMHDHLGSPRATYNQSKAAVARLDFSAYGSPLTTAGLNMDVGYTGHKWDGEMGTFYAPYRYYSPAQARWLTRDPLEMVDGLNMYTYVKLQTINTADPLGLFGVPGFFCSCICGYGTLAASICACAPATPPNWLSAVLVLVCAVVCSIEPSDIPDPIWPVFPGTNDPVPFPIIHM